MNRIEELKDLHIQSKPQLELFLNNVKGALVGGSSEKLYRIVYGIKDVVISYDSVIDELFAEIERLDERILDLEAVVHDALSIAEMERRNFLMEPWASLQEAVKSTDQD
ncbi:hypothetical protein [Paenibacillus sp. 1P03SA]|uniref:hypothetical protein n=1 Tax=Paenibacillus sp. 1P03SA TaxID=3132294 RepID=UPI0039A37DA1